MDDILNYLQETVGLQGSIKTLPDAELKQLPLYLSHAYSYALFELDGNSFLLAQERDDMPKTAGQLKKQSKAFMQHTGRPVVFVLYNQSAQLKRKMIQDRINFIVPENQIYLPDLLIALKENNRQSLTFSASLTPSAQLLLLYHLQIEDLAPFSFKDIAMKLAYSPKTITKIAAELKAKGLCRISGKKEKRLAFDFDRKQLWQKSEPLMLSPILKSYFTSRKENQSFCQSGDKALAFYTFLSDTNRNEYAISKTLFEELKEKDYWDYLDETEGDTQIEIWKYNPCLLSNNGYIDPLSLYLCYRDDENERVSAEIRNLIDKRSW